MPLGNPTPDPLWRIVEDGFELSREHEIESLFAISNGYLGARGSLPESSPLSSSGLFIAGIFELTGDRPAIPELVSFPDPTRFQVFVDGSELTLGNGVALEHRRTLDIRQGVLCRDWRHKDPAGRITRVREWRLASLSVRHALIQRIEITPENYSGPCRIESFIDSGFPGDDAAVGRRGLAHPELSRRDGRTVAVMRTGGSRHVVAVARVGWLESDVSERLEPGTGEPALDGPDRWTIDAAIGTTYRLDRLAVIRTSRDSPQPEDAALADVERLHCEGVDCLASEHALAWSRRWADADVEVSGDDDAQRALRFACYHLISAVNPDDERVSIGARTLTGRAYKGHVFWDTEIYLLPFYTLTHPASARALLTYRYHTLPAARAKARGLGWRGALYAWESAGTGEEATPPFAVAPDGEVVPIRNGAQENHVSAAVAYAVWQYWTATGDARFFRDAGAEILLETARFWASRGETGVDGLYHIRHVIGPDEYHEDVDDSAYTNAMAQWNLERGVETARILEECWPGRWRELSHQLDLSQEEPERWRDLAAAMYTGIDPATGLIEQFRGFFDLEEVDLTAYEPRVVPMDVLLGRERVRRSQVIKQADVVLLLYLLWDRFPPAVRTVNFRYYEPRCGHGSSLSPSIHALVAARLGDTDLAERYFRQAAEIDLGDNMGNASGGVHAAALGGLWQATVFGFAGLHFGRGGPATESRLMRGWRSVRFPVRWQGRVARLEVPSKNAPEGSS